MRERCGRELLPVTVRGCRSLHRRSPSLWAVCRQGAAVRFHGEPSHLPPPCKRFVIPWFRVRSLVVRCHFVDHHDRRRGALPWGLLRCHELASELRHAVVLHARLLSGKIGLFSLVFPLAPFCRRMLLAASEPPATSAGGFHCLLLHAVLGSAVVRLVWFLAEGFGASVERLRRAELRRACSSPVLCPRHGHPPPELRRVELSHRRASDDPQRAVAVDRSGSPVRHRARVVAPLVAVG